MSAALLAPSVRPRLGQLVRLLGSDQDGEALAAVRAIGRTLRSVGADWHALAATVEAEPVERVVYRERPAPAGGPPSWDRLERSQRLAWLAIVKGADWASAWDKEFATDMWGRIWAQPHRLLSPKQRSVLDQMVARAWAHGERV